MKNKASGGSQTRAVEGTFVPHASRQERRGVLESSSRNSRGINSLFTAAKKPQGIALRL